MLKPNWQKKFKNLPEIPQSKTWNEYSHTTLEQNITQKILKEGTITSEEEKILQELKNFYETLDLELNYLDYGNFTEEDIENFKNYITYAFNYSPLISNDVIIFKSYRLIVNEWILKENKSIENVKFLSYPKMDIVKKINKYNRANTPNSNVLYTTQNINTALLELKPPTNKLLTIGVWEQKNKNKTLISYPISHSVKAVNINESVAHSTYAFEEIAKKNMKIFFDILRHYMKILGREYTKPVNHHYEYLITSIFSERILKIRNDPNENFNFDLIIYPSVGNKYKTVNYAIHPKTADEEFVLSSLLEFEIEEAHYDYEEQFDDPELVTVAKVKNIRHPKSILSNGEIIW